jgi:hypothetical protein
MEELLVELRWRDDMNTRRQVETAITSYVRLLYDKQLDERAARSRSATMGGGYYHLLTGTSESQVQQHGRLIRRDSEWR